MIPSHPYNPSLNSALICASYTGDIPNSRQMFEAALGAAGASSAAAKPLVDLELLVRCCSTELQLTLRRHIGSGKL